MRGIVKGGWFDFPDFYKQASGYAKSYCKNHPEADRETVYIAASEALLIMNGRRSSGTTN